MIFNSDLSEYFLNITEMKLMNLLYSNISHTQLRVLKLHRQKLARNNGFLKYGERSRPVNQKTQQESREVHKRAGI